ncbi:hypothetical protein LQE94_10165 [Mediterraneibacter sp. NSJ-151]|uniref:hypothetical protein n=1 Tax=Mediterraneibacter sp. NSJ-151 TaxID=2897708 RepID=UPI001F0B442A|nr:hypothetical protein [Mediterraneibacter sp. NSJ-151]MCH4280379.1 hypothetical protein [Mediterraneibacter sp. NSJ-151]
MSDSVKRLKRQLIVAASGAFLSAFALTSATYAWYVSNNTVQATTSTISAKANSFVLQIAKLSEGAQYGDNQSLVSITDGHRISPSSTNDVKNWYTCLGWGQDGKVHSYEKRDDLDANGKYTVDTDHYAYIKSEYILYTITETGLCDVYLNGSEPSGAIQVTPNGTSTSDVIPDSMRVGITIQNLNGTTPIGNEELVLVYAPKNETGKGNDATAIDGWTYVKDATTLALVSYPHVYENTYTWIDSNSLQHDYAATKVGDNYMAPTTNASPLVTDVDYDGVIMRVYVWLEGTDADCVNNSNEDDPSTYNVTLSLAGVAK